MALPQKQTGDSGCRDNKCSVDGKVFKYTDGINGTVYGNGSRVNYENQRKPVANYMSPCNNIKNLPGVSC